MNDVPATPPGRPRPADLIVPALLAALLFVPWSGARDLWNPNEPVYGQAVAEMHARGDWVVPTVNGATFGEKPILYFWMALAAARLTGGVNEWALRLPSALAGTALVVLLVLLATPYVGRRRARTAAIVLATTFIVFWSARQAQMDLLLAACTLGAVVAVSRVAEGESRALVGWALAGLAAGLGFLAKGPVGLICPGLALVPWLAWCGKLHMLARPAFIVAPVVFLAVAAPWYLVLAARGEHAFLYEVLVRQNFVRFVDPWDHQSPWWYFLKYFWIDMAPWALFLPLALRLEPDDPRERRLHGLCWIWIVATVAFFSLSASKRSPYILPLAPAPAVLVAALVERWRERRLAQPRLAAARVLVGLTALVALAGAVWLAGAGQAVLRGDAGLETAADVVCLVLGIGAAAMLVALAVWRVRPFLALPTFAVFLGGVYLAGASVLPEADTFKSHRVLSQAIAARAGDRPLRGFHEWKWRASYSFYAQRPIPNLESLQALREYWERPDEVFVIVERGRLDEARQIVGAAEPLESQAVGSNFAYLFSNRVDSGAASRSGTGVD